ncbi:MAG: hypothetical protein NZ847_04285 [Acidobacteria bacterium]|nr:hypothetical protein [Acidobacteriota bacterium]
MSCVCGNASGTSLATGPRSVTEGARIVVADINETAGEQVFQLDLIPAEHIVNKLSWASGFDSPPRFKGR